MAKYGWLEWDGSKMAVSSSILLLVKNSLRISKNNSSSSYTLSNPLNGMEAGRYP
jgi:hypothetical protein